MADDEDHAESTPTTLDSSHEGSPEGRHPSALGLPDQHSTQAVLSFTPVDRLALGCASVGASGFAPPCTPSMQFLARAEAPSIEAGC
eukprot:765562-Alexandrium_andersonii.AAC.1